MNAIASQIIGVSIVNSAVYSVVDKKKTPKLHVTGLCAGNSPITDEFPAQRASNAGYVTIWWRHHVSIVAVGAGTIGGRPPAGTNHRYKHSPALLTFSECDPQETCGFPSQTVDNAETVSISRRHHGHGMSRFVCELPL